MKLRLQNVGLARIVVKDPQGYTYFVAEVEGGHTSDFDVSVDLMQRLAPQLRALEQQPVKDALGNVLIGLRWSVIADGADDRAQPEGVQGLPTLNEFQAANYSSGTPGADKVATGTNLLGNQVKATAQILVGTARLDLEAVVPGAPGNGNSCQIITPSSTLDVSVSGSKVIVRPAVGGSTVAAIVSAINAHAGAKLLVQAATGVGGTINAAAAETFLTGGIGPGVSLTLGGTACAITELVTGSVTFDPPGSVSANGRIVPLEYRNGPHVSRLSIPVVT
jgi:hypothetical protein